MENCEVSYPSIEEEVVGFDDDVENITKDLTSGRKRMHVISIIGMAGIGKTAVARKIYNSHSIILHFKGRAWCSVSQIYSTRKLFEILEQITGDHHKYADVDYPEAMVRRQLSRKRYVIVLDNVWKSKAWYDLRGCFPNCDNGSRILVTTRDQQVATRITKLSKPCSLPFLKDEKSWELLEKKLFQGEHNSCPLELRSVGQLVAKQCKGLPSLIISIAGILSSKKREASLWLEVARDISSHSFEEEMSMKMIQSSYDHLLDYVKPCLLYMGLFPKNYEIPVSALLKWWIAEEFVQDTNTLNTEQLSKKCLNNLVSRNLVVVSKTRWNGRMKCCMVLDQVREFCLRKITEEKFMQLIVPYNYYSCQPVEQRLRMYIHDT